MVPSDDATQAVDERGDYAPLEQLKSACCAADSAFREFYANVKDIQRQMEKDSNQKIAQFVKSLYGGELKALEGAYRASDSALRIATEEAAKRGDNAPVPLGRRLVRTVIKKKPGGYRWDREQVKQYGIFEVFLNGDAFPDNKSSRRRPSHGQYVVRILKSDGTPSKDLEELHCYDGKWTLGEWKPVDNGGEG